MSRPHRLGLTGSIGMGKSTTLQFFRDAGAAAWDADAAVHRIYGPGGGGAEALFPIVPAVVASGAVDRSKLRAAVTEAPDLLPAIEAAIHPIVQADRDRFLATCEAPVAVCDIPLLYETGADAAFDAVVLVTAPAEIQRARVLARPNMTPELFETILAKQRPDAEKRQLADHIIDTSRGLAHAEARVREIMAAVQGER